MSTPEISVAIPAYNYGRYLPRAVSSVLDQEISSVEVIVIDDCSTDDTPQAIAPFLNDSRFRYQRNESNLGAVRNINSAIAATRGKYVLLLGADDFLMPGALTVLRDALIRYPEAGFAYGNYVIADESDRIVETIRHPGHLPMPLPPLRDDFADLLAYDDYINLGTTLFRREIIERFGFFDELLTIDDIPGRFFRATDWDLCLRLSLAGIRSAFVYSPLSAFRVHSTQASVGGEFDRSGIAFREYAILLERYVRPENAMRLAGHENAISQRLEAKFEAFSRQVDPNACGNLGQLTQRIGTTEGFLREIAAAPFDAELPEAPKIAAIVVADDDPEVLLPTLTDLAAQSHPVELLVINRGRMDLAPLVRSGHCLPAIGASHATARHYGVQLTTAPALAFIAPGTRLPRDHFAKLANALAGAGTCVAESSAFSATTPPSNDGSSWRVALTTLLPDGHPWHGQVPPLACFALRRHTYYRCAGFDARLPVMDDLDFLLRVRHLHTPQRIDSAIETASMYDSTLAAARRCGQPDAIVQSLQMIADRWKPR